MWSTLPCGSGRDVRPEDEPHPQNGGPQDPAAQALVGLGVTKGLTEEWVVSTLHELTKETFAPKPGPTLKPATDPAADPNG